MSLKTKGSICSMSRRCGFPSDSGQRNLHGAAMAIAELGILIPIILILTAFLADLFQAGWYKNRLAFVLTQSASYGASLPEDADLTKLATDMAKQLCAKNSLESTNVKLNVKQISVGDADAVSISGSIRVPLVPGNILPASINLSDTATALIPANRVSGAIALTPYPYSAEIPASNLSLYIPIVQPRHQLPIWQFPYDSALNNLHLVQGNSPNPKPVIDSYYNSRPSLY